jgi:hypothetical protein
MNFGVTGPFELSRHGTKKIITKQSLKELKFELDKQKTGLSDACGCYVFALRAGKGCTPYYVGQACKRAIIDEALNPSNREKYNEVLSDSKGTPILFILPMRTPTGKLRKKKQASGRIEAVEFLERWLIMKAIEKNPGLINNRETRFIRNIHVVGTLNAKKGEGTSASQLLCKTLW